MVPGRSRSTLDQWGELLADLGLDSLALIELLVMVEERYGLTGHRAELMTRDWRGITASRLYEECCRAGTT